MGDMMVKRLLFFVLAVVMVPCLGFSAESHLVRMDAFGVIGGASTINYEWAVDRDRSLSLEGVFWNRTLSNWKLDAVGAGIAYRFFRENALKGVFWGPEAKIVSINAKLGDASTGVTAVVVNYNVGHRWIWDGGFALDIVTGFSYFSGSLTIGYDTLALSGFTWGGVRVNIGYAW
ncbi:MAG: DUF3575 domain-containing protein [Elusimicrobiota bacterium]